MKRTCTVAVAVATVSYALSATVGLASALRLNPKRYYQHVHHAFYLTTLVTTAAATVSLARAADRSSSQLAPALVPLGLLPLVGSNPRSWHAGVALVAAPFYGRTLLDQLRSAQCSS